MLAQRKKNVLIKESNAIAKATLQPVADSVWSERIIAQLTVFNHIDDIEFFDQEFTIGELIGNQKISATKRLKIEKNCKQLVQSYFEIKKGNDFELYPIFRSVKFQKNKITARFNSDLRPHFLQLKSEFTVYSLPEFKSLSSIYSQQFYRNLNSWAKRLDVTIPINELHHLIGAPKSITSNFSNFKARVLNIATKEINAKTSLKFDWEAIKTGRKVTAVRFVFGELDIENLEKTRHTVEKKTEKEILLELQSESFACWKKHHAKSKICKPRKTVKRCEYCTTRGKMSTKSDRF